HRLTGNEDARRRLVVVGPVVAGPLLHVGIDDARRGTAEGRLPRDAIAVGEADLKLRGIGYERAAVNVVALVDGINHPRTGLWIGHGHQPRGELVLQPFRFRTVADDAAALAAFQVDVHLTESHRVRLGMGPIDVLPEG